MAKLSAFRSDTKAINDGEWVRVNEALYDDLDILTRGYTDQFVDAQNSRLIRAAEPFNGDQARIPNNVRRTINGALLREFLVIDVRNLIDDDTGEPVTREAFLAMLDNPEFNRLSRACFEAAGRVTTRAAKQATDAVGNLSSGSAGN